MSESKEHTHDIELVDRFVQDGKLYITFKITGHPHPYLFFTSLEEPLRALYCGPGLDTLVEKAKSEKGACIECKTCVNVPAGVALSGEKIVEMDLTVEEARKILGSLKDTLNQMEKNDLFEHVVL